MQSLPERMFAGETLQLRGNRVVAAQRQVSVDPGLQRGEPQLIQAVGLGADKTVVAEIGEHRAAPQREGSPQRLSGLSGPARVQRRPARSEQFLKPRRVQVLIVYAQHVA